MLGRMAVRVRGFDDEAGRPVELVLGTCWRCGAMVDETFVSLHEHIDRCHPPDLPGDAAPAAEPRHALRDDRRPPD